jgi:uncharacterized RDD family membrane protein YckC
MNYITILTPDNIEIEYRLAGPGSRIAATTIDVFIQSLAIILMALILFFAVLGGDLANINTMDNVSWFLGLLILAVFLIFFGYYIVTETATGRTVGKRLLGLRVIRENGAPITLTQSLIRNIIKLLIDITGIGILTMMFSKKCKRVGDMAAGTIVIAENADKVSLGSMLAQEVAIPLGRPPLPNGYTINVREYRLLKEYFARQNGFCDGGMAAYTAFVRHFGKKFSVPPEAISEEMLKHLFNNGVSEE